MKRSVNLFKNMILHKFNRRIVPKFMPYKLTFSITYFCNAQCKTCNIWKIYRKNPNLSKKELTLAEIENFFKINGKYFSWISITGGEPFIRNDITDIVEIISKYTNAKIVSINTNGIANDKILNDVKQILKRIDKKILLFIVISIDGPEKIHDYLRGIPGAYKNSQKLYDDLKKMMKKYKNLRVRRELLISRLNINYIKDEIDRMISENTDFIITFAQESKYYMNCDSNISLKHSKYIDKVIEIIRYIVSKKGSSLTKNPEDILNFLFYKFGLKYFKENKTQVIPCYSGFSSILMNPYGYIYPCIMINRDIGNIRDYKYNLEKLLKNKKSMRIRKEIARGNCPGCWTPCEAYQTILENLPKTVFK